MKHGLRILLAVSSMFLTAGALFAPIYAVFVAQIGGDLFTAGSAYAIYGVVAGLVVFLLSKWEDHVKHQEKLVIAGYTLRLLGFAGLLFVSRPLHLFIVEFIIGAGEALGVPAYDALYSKWAERGKLASSWGAWESMAYITTAIGSFAGGWIANNYGFNTVFVIMTVVALFGLIISLDLLFTDSSGKNFAKVRLFRKPKMRR